MPGGDALRRISEGIDAAEVIVLFVSPTYLGSEHCNREVQTAVSWKKPVLPVALPGLPTDWPPRPSAGAFAGTMAPLLAGKVYVAAGEQLAERMIAALRGMGVAPQGRGGGGGAAALPAAPSPLQAAAPAPRELPTAAMGAARVVALMRASTANDGVARAGARRRSSS